MFAYPLRAAALTVAAAIGLSACTTPYGYGYSGVSLGYGSGYGPYGSYGYGYPGYGYSRLGYGYAPYWGWYDGFYYPGTGFYVYDSYRRPHRWSDAHRRYWTERRHKALSGSTKRTNIVIRDNWRDFDRDRIVSRGARADGNVTRPHRVERRVERSDAKANRGKERRSEFRSGSGRSERGTRSNSRHNRHDREN